MKAAAIFLILSIPFATVAKDATPDTSFYKDAAEAGIAEVKVGKLASTKATSADVKDASAHGVKG